MPNDWLSPSDNIQNNTNLSKFSLDFQLIIFHLACSSRGQMFQHSMWFKKIVFNNFRFWYPNISRLVTFTTLVRVTNGYKWYSPWNLHDLWLLLIALGDLWWPLIFISLPDGLKFILRKWIQKMTQNHN